MALKLFRSYGFFVLAALVAVSGSACFNSEKQPNNIVIGSGWYDLERSADGKNWWVWTREKGQLIVEMDKEIVLQMNGGVGAIERPNKVEVSLNGALVKTWDVTGDKYEQKPFETLPLTLKAGKNTIEFKSVNQPAKIATDPRELAIAIDDITLSNQDGSVKYELAR
ncbi:MAG: hypothetical protein HZB29_05080 [Nitrospinae bacterium]|nr:hypothetical protein [Nitrospinota bacterium]